MKKIIFTLIHCILFYSNRIIKRKDYQNRQELRSREDNLKAASLRGFDEKQAIFVHIPKAAGVSINSNLFNSLGGGHRTIVDYMLTFPPYQFNKYFKFTFVRNPWDRLVSSYFFLKNGGFHEKDKKWYNNNISHFHSFEEFVVNWINQTNIRSYIHFKPQYTFIYQGNFLLVDKVYKIENMETAFFDITKKLNLDLQPIHKNKSAKKPADFRSFYNEKTKLIVQNAYEKDIKLFNYKFDLEI